MPSEDSKQLLRSLFDAWSHEQRHTARRVLARLVDEHQLGELTYSSVRDYVARRRPQIAAEAGRCTEKAFVLQTHDPAAEALCGTPHKASAPGGCAMIA